MGVNEGLMSRQCVLSFSTIAVFCSVVVSLPAARAERQRIAGWEAAAIPVTFVTLNTRGDPLISKIGNFPEHVINMGRGRQLHGADVSWLKVEWFREFLKGWPANELVVFVDGDVFWGGCSRSAFMDAYNAIVLESGASIVFNGEMTCWEQDCRAVPDLPSWSNVSDAQWAPYAFCRKGVFNEDCAARRRCEHCSDPPAVKFLNSGFVMGPAGKLSRMADWAGENYEKMSTVGDQSVYAKYWLEHPSEVTLDYGAKLALSLSDLKENVLEVNATDGTVLNKALGHTQCMIHGNGWSEGFGNRMADSTSSALKALHGDDVGGAASFIQQVASSGDTQWQRLIDSVQDARTSDVAARLW